MNGTPLHDDLLIMYMTHTSYSISFIWNSVGKVFEYLYSSTVLEYFLRVLVKSTCFVKVPGTRVPVKVPGTRVPVLKLYPNRTCI